MKTLFNFKKFRKEITGFTLIESLVSIAIVLIAVMAPLTLILNSITSISQNKNRIVGSYLAEEVVEDLRAYRDGFSLACSDIEINFNSDGEIADGTCNRDGAGISIQPTVGYLIDSDGNPNYSNQNIAWKLFIDKLADVINKEVYLDRNSFNYLNLANKVVSYTSCGLEVNTLNGYLCNLTSKGQYERSVKLTPITGNILKVEVNVVYAKSYLLGVPDKSLKVIDYIYER